MDCLKRQEVVHSSPTSKVSTSSTVTIYLVVSSISGQEKEILVVKAAVTVIFNAYNHVIFSLRNIVPSFNTFSSGNVLLLYAAILISQSIIFGIFL